MGEKKADESLTSSSTLKSAAILDLARNYLSTEEAAALKKKIGLVYQLNISPKKLGIDEEIFVMDLKNGKVTKGPYEGKADAIFSFVDADFLAIASGKMNPQMAFMRGKLKVKGSMSAAQKFTPDIFPKPAKL